MEKIFVFDLGNVIVRPMSVKKLYEMLECKVSFENFYEYFKGDKSSDDIHRGLISTEEYIKRILKFSGSDKNVEEFIGIFTGPIRNGLFKNTVELIDRLKKEKQKVCMLSNLRKIDFEWFSTQYDISKFDNLYLSYQMHLMKPDDEIYIEMIKDLGVSSSSIYFFDDSQVNVDAAKKLGINAYCVTGDTINKINL
ncbi:MAG TPA: HAD-IA family hydrolase [Candidatus Merdicola faecigallinarum]|uniref:HAD-IA family hydrolase n=1 Tax=Candidatus Merdicola faecigallinarum TaxID=2840862 RepID=A0A9D1LZX1_9FIRM|nr:HAD-IA family hydrolase [Candidatus Merdicola faecigallinarum]